MSVVVPVSGSHNNLLMSGDNDFHKVVATLKEMDKVENIFECFRMQLNTMNIEFPRHTVLPHVLSMVETTMGPLKNETEQREFAENLKMTVESVMPWEKFLAYST